MPCVFCSLLRKLVSQFVKIYFWKATVIRLLWQSELLAWMVWNTYAAGINEMELKLRLLKECDCGKFKWLQTNMKRLHWFNAIDYTRKHNGSLRKSSLSLTRHAHHLPGIHSKVRNMLGLLSSWYIFFLPVRLHLSYLFPVPVFLTQTNSNLSFYNRDGDVLHHSSVMWNHLLWENMYVWFIVHGNWGVSVGQIFTCCVVLPPEVRKRRTSPFINRTGERVLLLSLWRADLLFPENDSTQG